MACGESEEEVNEEEANREEKGEERAVPTRRVLGPDPIACPLPLLQTQFWQNAPCIML